jgi:tRNA A37 threonylcarbamoyladenosine dehydratase
MNWQSRTELLFGNEKIEILRKSHVLVAGLGGVGAVAAEMLVRAGIGSLTIADSDVIQASNRNRQIIALSSTEGMHKTEVMASRLMDINPALNLVLNKNYLIRNAIPDLLETPFDYVIDAIDTMSPKLYLIVNCLEKRYKLISSMGAGGKFNPEEVKIADISKSYQCRLAHYIRKHLHKKGIFTGFKVVYSPEPVSKTAIQITDGDKNKKSIPGTVSYMPFIFGCYAASVVIRDLTEIL